VDYIKLHKSFLSSDVWKNHDATRLLITILALCVHLEQKTVYIWEDMLGSMCGMTGLECRKNLSILEKFGRIKMLPDPIYGNTVGFEILVDDLS